MLFNKLIDNSKKYFPNLKIKYKNESMFMKFLGFLLFFNKNFMTEYITTIGSTIYFPSRSKIDEKPTSAMIVLLHELIHIYDSNRFKFMFGFLYLFPQILAPFSLLLLLVSWKLALPLFIILLLPLPAYFRMYFEKRAYLASLYIIKSLGAKLKFSSLLKTQKEYFLRQFKESAYYYMWIFDMTPQFDEAMAKIQSGKRPYEDPVFDIIDDLISQVETNK